MNSEHVTSEIGKKIRDLRKQNGLTQQELADRAELTKGFISQLERGQVSPSVVTLFDLIEILGTTPSAFFENTAGKQIVFGEEDYFEKVDEEGSVTEWLVPSAQSNQMEPVRVTIPPHASIPLDAPHNGEEFGYVLSGRLTLYRGEAKYDVRTGESFYYEADTPHRLENPGSRPCRLIWVSTPPSF